MSRVIKIVVPVLLVSLFLATPSLRAQDRDGADSQTDSDRDQTWYRQETTYQPDSRAIIHHKAQVRAAQRNARMASLQWYGMSNARPTAAPTPFSSLYSPVWQQPGGRPFAWTTAGWPTSVVYVR